MSKKLHNNVNLFNRLTHNCGATEANEFVLDTLLNDNYEGFKLFRKIIKKYGSVRPIKRISKDGNVYFGISFPDNRTKDDFIDMYDGSVQKGANFDYTVEIVDNGQQYIEILFNQI